MCFACVASIRQQGPLELACTPASGLWEVGSGGFLAPRFAAPPKPPIQGPSSRKWAAAENPIAHNRQSATAPLRTASSLLHFCRSAFSSVVVCLQHDVKLSFELLHFEPVGPLKLAFGWLLEACQNVLVLGKRSFHRFCRSFSLDPNNDGTRDRKRVAE